METRLLSLMSKTVAALTSATAIDWIGLLDFETNTTLEISVEPTSLLNVTFAMFKLLKSRLYHQRETPCW
jgi:hypothetical protein